LGFDRFADAFGVEFATFEKIEDLVGGQRIFADREDDLAVGGLHGETDSYPMLPQLVDGLHDVVGSFCEVAQGKLSVPTSLRKWRSPSRGKNGVPTGFAQILHFFGLAGGCMPISASHLGIQ
jgi:hypothetical protein